MTETVPFTVRKTLFVRGSASMKTSLNYVLSLIADVTAVGSDTFMLVNLVFSLNRKSRLD